MNRCDMCGKQFTHLICITDHPEYHDGYYCEVCSQYKEYIEEGSVDTPCPHCGTMRPILHGKPCCDKDKERMDEITKGVNVAMDSIRSEPDDTEYYPDYQRPLIERLKRFCLKGKICPDYGAWLQMFFSRDADSTAWECRKCKKYYDVLKEVSCSLEEL